MNPKLEQQELLMRQALKMIDDIRSTEAFYKAIDPAYAKDKVKPMQEEYAYLMSRLAGKIVADAGVDVTAFHKNVVQIAEEVLS